MRKIAIKLAVVFTLVISLVIVLSSSAFAASKTSESSGVTQLRCTSSLVHLNGDQPATVTCLNGSTSTEVHPDSNAVDCGSNPGALHLWMGNDTGADMCITGTGFLDLTAFCYWTDWPFQCTSWNDAASSAYTGCAAGVFFTDIDGNGNQEGFTPETLGSFGITWPSISDKTLSSVQINSWSSSC